MRIKSLVAVLLLTGSAALWAQGVSDSTLLHPSPDTWPQYNGTYDGQRHAKAL